MSRPVAVAAALLLLACRESGGATDAKGEDPGEQRAARPRDALVGKLAPSATLHLLGGERVELSELIGRKPIYLKFWATWCVPCREQMPHLEAAHRKYGDRIAMFAVDLGLNDSVDAVRAFQTAHSLTVPIAIDDGSLAESFRVSVTPQHVLVDRAGVVRYVGHGASADLDRALESLLRDAPAGAAPPPPATATKAPLRLTLLDGSPFSLSEKAGRPVALTFIKASCDTYLAESRPAMADACSAHARKVESMQQSNPHITWVTIAHPVWTTAKSLHAFRERLSVNTAIGIDETAAWFHHFRIRDVPTTILLDQRGAELARSGGRGDDLPELLARLR